MKGVIASIAPRARVIDLAHGVAPGAIDEGAFFLAATVRHFPEGTVFVAVVDPGVGSAREAVLLDAAGRLFLAPDNGILGGVLERAPGARAWVVRERRHFLSEVSATFHGRDVFAPVAARLAAGRIRPEDTGPEVALGRLARAPSGSGKVVSIDRFGNLVTDVEAPRGAAAAGGRAEALLPRAVEVAGRRIERAARTYAEAPEGEPFFYIGSFGTVEVAIRGASAAEALGARRGAAVSTQLEEHPQAR